MGMFDRINYEVAARCYACKRLLSNFQSKDGPCRLYHLRPDEVEGFYALCDCGVMNHFRVELLQPRPPVPYNVEQLDKDGLPIDTTTTTK